MPDRPPVEFPRLVWLVSRRVSPAKLRLRALEAGLRAEECPLQPVDVPVAYAAEVLEALSRRGLLTGDWVLQLFVGAEPPELWAILRALFPMPTGNSRLWIMDVLTDRVPAVVGRLATVARLEPALAASCPMDGTAPLPLRLGRNEAIDLGAELERAGAVVHWEIEGDASAPPARALMPGLAARRLPASQVWLSVHPVTQEAFTRVLGRNPSCFSGAADSRWRPVERVSVEDALEFCSALTRRLAHGEVRLPTETEWREAATYATPWNPLLPWGGPSRRARFGGETRVVGIGRPSSGGFHDTLGHVWQWVASMETGWVQRGGGWRTPDRVPGVEDVRSGSVPDEESGFRVAWEQERDV